MPHEESVKLVAIHWSKRFIVLQGDRRDNAPFRLCRANHKASVKLFAVRYSLI